MAIEIKSYAVKSVADITKTAAAFGTGEVTFGNGEFNTWMLAVTGVSYVKETDGDKSIGHAIYRAYATAKNAHPRTVRKIDLTNADTLKTKAADINVFAKASLLFGAKAVFEFVDNAILITNKNGFDASAIIKLIRASVAAKKLSTAAEIKKVAADVKGKAKEKNAKASKPAAPVTFEAAVTNLRNTLKGFGSKFKGGQGKLFLDTLKAFDALMAEAKAAPKAKANGNGKAKPVMAPRVDASLN